MRKVTKKSAESSIKKATDSAKKTKKISDSANSQNLNENNRARSAHLESRPLRGAKNRIQGCSSATADFLLEADKRGSPPKSEKRQLLGTHLNNSRGEREQGGAALLREEKNSNENAESINKSQGGLQCRFCESTRNDEFISDSAPSPQADLDTLQKKIRYYFRDENLLRKALTHKSFDKHTNNERLEFLGDAVMDLIIGEYVFRTQERGNEGDLTRIRAAMVNENSLANLANNIDLGKYLFISFSENRNKGRKKPSILSDAFEALMGAIYLDGGLESARAVAHNLLENEYREVEIESLFVDYKSALQELTQAICGNLPKYVLLKSSGPDHSKKFTMQVLINGEEFATARGKSKKEAEQICAKIAYNRIKKEVI